MTRLAQLLGGPIPAIYTGRDVHPVDGTTYRIELVWLNRSATAEYHTPNLPRAEQRRRAEEKARIDEQVRRYQAGEPALQPGDVIPVWAAAYLAQCVEVRDCEFTVWKRAEGDERYARNDDGTLDRSQAYEWIAWSNGEYAGGHTTTEGLLRYEPITVLKVAGNA